MSITSFCTRPMVDALDTFVQQHLGVPWVDECWDLTRGADCWTWLHWCYAAMGISLPRNVWAAKPLFRAIPPPGAPGDVLHFWPPNAPREHLGVRLRGPYFTDCNWSGSGVAIHDLTVPPWRDSLKGAWRYQGEPS
jgi:cell wall-associated NlpC family hydrolase